MNFPDYLVRFIVLSLFEMLTNLININRAFTINAGKNNRVMWNFSQLMVESERAKPFLPSSCYLLL